MPTLVPLGDEALLVRFADTLSDDANRMAVASAHRLAADPPDGVVEVVPQLVSVLLRLRPGTDFWRVSGETSLRLVGTPYVETPTTRDIVVDFDGPDLLEVAAGLGLSPGAFVVRHNAVPVRVLATGFAPGFVYCGFHPAELTVQRRTQVRPVVPAGSVLFAAGQTAIAATPIRTGWHLIGTTSFRNFDPMAAQPTVLRPGDGVRFVGAM